MKWISLFCFVFLFSFSISFAATTTFTSTTYGFSFDHLSNYQNQTEYFNSMVNSGAICTKGFIACNPDDAKKIQAEYLNLCNNDQACADKRMAEYVADLDGMLNDAMKRSNATTDPNGSEEFDNRQTTGVGMFYDHFKYSIHKPGDVLATHRFGYGSEDNVVTYKIVGDKVVGTQTYSSGYNGTFTEDPELKNKYGVSMFHIVYSTTATGETELGAPQESLYCAAGSIVVCFEIFDLYSNFPDDYNLQTPLEIEQKRYLREKAIMDPIMSSFRFSAPTSTVKATPALPAIVPATTVVQSSEPGVTAPSTAASPENAQQMSTLPAPEPVVPMAPALTKKVNFIQTAVEKVSAFFRTLFR